MNTVVASRPRSALALLFPFVFGVEGIAFAVPADIVGDRVFADAFELPPVADFSPNALGFEVTFTDQSTDPIGSIAAWSWDFGDGSTDTAQNPVHTFAAAGSYTVGETVVDGATGQTSVVSKLVAVVPCGTLTSYLHDFKFAGTAGGHPDFEAFSCASLTQGLASSTITPGGVPTLSSTGGGACGQQIESAASFAQWFVDDPINFPIRHTLTLAQNSPGAFSYSSSAYFPIDGEAFNDTAVDQNGNLHNFAFTTLLHTQFRYGGGEAFQFIGDDDVWVYINGHLVIDLGGVHGALSGAVTLNAAQAVALGLAPGQIYRLDLFRAERHTTRSNFNVSTTMCLSDAH